MLFLLHKSAALLIGVLAIRRHARFTAPGRLPEADGILDLALIFDRFFSERCCASANSRYSLCYHANTGIHVPPLPPRHGIGGVWPNCRLQVTLVNSQASYGELAFQGVYKVERVRESLT